MGSRWRELDKSITETGQLCDLSLVTAAWRCHLIAPEDMAMSGIWLKTQGKVQKPSLTRETKGNKCKAGIKAATASTSHRAEEKLPQKGAGCRGQQGPGVFKNQLCGERVIFV